jgi:hypothetical protein
MWAMEACWVSNLIRIDDGRGFVRDRTITRRGGGRFPSQRPSLSGDAQTMYDRRRHPHQGSRAGESIARFIFLTSPSNSG